MQSYPRENIGKTMQMNFEFSFSFFFGQIFINFRKLIYSITGMNKSRWCSIWKKKQKYFFIFVLLSDEFFFLSMETKVSKTENYQNHC